MELKTESMENMKKVVAKCLDELMSKSDLTPAETKAALDGFKLHDELCCRIEDCKAVEESPERGYSGHDVPYRQYHITSYGMPAGMYSERSYGRRMSHENRSYGYSEGPQYGVRGWYQSNDYPVPMNGYSRHSIGDRVISMVEKMMDSTESEYERQELQKYIRTIRAMMMSE